jgi:hypothetical protein
MAKLVAALRLLLTFVLGGLVGAITLVVLISQETGVGNFIVAATPQVKELRAGLERVEGQRDEMTRRLENLATVLQQVEKRYEELGKRFEAFEAAQPRRPARGPGRATGPGAPAGSPIPVPPVQEPVP